jgi:LysR family transcriptional regulator, transcriptional activator of the cysJI operon
VFPDRCDRHKSLNLNAGKGQKAFHLLADNIRLEAELRSLARDIYLEQHPWEQTELHSDPVNIQRKIHGINGMNELNQRKNFADLVPLEMTYEVPTRERWKQGRLRNQFLRTAFSKNHLTRIECLAHPGRSLRLRYRNQPDLARIAASRTCGSRNLCANPLKTIANVVHKTNLFTSDEYKLFLSDFLMHIQSFKVFSNLAETSSFSKAAQMNGITQSAVSQQVRALERRFRVKLIERGRKNFSLTPEGRAFLQASHQVIEILGDLEGRIHNLQNLVAGELCISTIFSIGLHELPPYLKIFRQAHPQVDVRVEYRRSSEVYLSVLDGRADIGLVAYPAPRRGLEAVTFWSDRLVLICSPTHPLASRRQIPLSALQDEKFIAFEPDLPTRREIDRKLRSEGVKVKLVLEFDNIETVKRAVEIENGVSIVPEAAVRDEVEAGLLAAVEFGDPALRRPLGALIRRSARISPALREFLTLLEQTTASESDGQVRSDGKAKT